jgi:beta-lactamase class D
VKELINEAHDGYPTLYGKTGTAVLDNGVRVGWYVGFIEKEGKCCAFALNILGRKGVSGQVARQTMLKVLTDRNYLP